VLIEVMRTATHRDVEVAKKMPCTERARMGRRAEIDVTGGGLSGLPSPMRGPASYPNGPSPRIASLLPRCRT
jgi:hypothetical protein